MKIILDKNQILKGLPPLLLLGLLLGAGWAQPPALEDALSQKIMLENTIRQRVSDAIFKILKNDNFIVDVNVSLANEPQTQYTTVYEPPVKPTVGPEARTRTRKAGEKPTVAVVAGEKGETTAKGAGEGTTRPKRKVVKKRRIKTYIPADIPGFPGIQKPGFELYEEEVPAETTTAELPVFEEGRRIAPPETTAMGSTIVTPGEEIIEESPLATKPSAEKELVTSPETSVATTPWLARHTVASTLPPIFKVKKVHINIVLDEKVSPSIVENVRSVAMVAAHFNQARGDVMNIMTAPFQKAPGEEVDTEEVLLKSIAERIAILEKRQRKAEEERKLQELKAEQRRLELEQEARRKQEEELRRLREKEEERLRQREEELRKLRMAEEARLAQEQRRFFQERQRQARERLRQDSLRLALLTKQLQDLKAQLASADLAQEQRARMELEKRQREAEKSTLEARQEALRRKLQALEEQKLASAAAPPPANDTLLYIILGAVVLFLLLVALGFALFSRARAPQAITAAAPVVTPSDDQVRRAAEEAARESEERIKKLLESEKVASAAAPTTPPRSTPAPEIVPMGEEEVRAEVDEIKKSVVSMAVGHPETASAIISGWLEETPSTPPSAEESSAAEEGEA